VGHDAKGNAETALVQGVTGKDGKFTATQIGNDSHGGLVDKTTGTGAYTASVNGSGVNLSTNGGKTSSTGVFVNGTPNTSFKDAGWANGGALSAFHFDFTNSKLEANQTAAGSFWAEGSVADAERSLRSAGFFHAPLNEEPGTGYRSWGQLFTGANSGHFIIDPAATLPAYGNMHFGEHNPFMPPFGLEDHCKLDNAC
jgi:hypothetical protein